MPYALKYDQLWTQAYNIVNWWIKLYNFALYNIHVYSIRLKVVILMLMEIFLKS